MSQILIPRNIRSEMGRNKWNNQRYCIQDKKFPFQDIRSSTHETPSLLPRNVNKDATSINNFTNKNVANKRRQTL